MWLVQQATTFFVKDFINLFVRDRERERERGREAETQAEGEAGSMQGARCGTRSQDSRITPWAEGRHQTAEPPRDPQQLHFLKKDLFERESKGEREHKWEEGQKEREKQTPLLSREA